MMHPPRFLQTILACPDDDTPRLHYANWLEGCDDSLGEFIRLQCDLVRHASHDSRIGLERREQVLRAENQARWSGAIAGCVEWCSFQRGFVEEIAIAETDFIRHAGRLFRLAPIRDVHLRTSGAGLDDLPELPYLKHTLFLDLSAQPLGNAGVERLADSPLLAQVHGLNLASCRLGDGALDALIDSPDLGALRELYLNDNPIGDDSIRRFVLTPLAENLHFLDIRHTLASTEATEALRRLLGDKCRV